MQLFFKLGAAISLAHAVSSWGMDAALAEDGSGDSPVCVVLCSVLAGCGGGLLAQALSLYQAMDTSQQVRPEPHPASNTVLKGSALSLQRTFVDSMAYYSLIDPHGLLANPWLPFIGSFAHHKPQARALLGLYVLFNTLLDHVQPGLHVLSRPMSLACALLNVQPMILPEKLAGTPAKDHTCTKEKKRV